jgi:hypothetical protein
MEIITLIKKHPLRVLFVLLALILMLYFSFKTHDDVATMIAGLWSAVATVSLGGIAIYQSWQYKKLSDKAMEDYQQLQVEIKYLTNNMATAIDTLQKIEKSKYYPNLEKWNYSIFKLGKETLCQINEDDNNVIQLNYINVNEEDIFKEINEIVEKYNIFGFCIKNVGEKVIRNFCANEMSISYIKNQGYFIINKSCDIKPGQFVYVFMVNLPDYLSLEGEFIKIDFTMNNLILDKFVCHCEIHFYMDEEIPGANIDLFYPLVNNDVD